MIRSKLKEIADSRGLSIRQIATGSDCHFEVVRRMYNDTMERYPRDLLDKLCEFLEVDVGDLLEYEKKEL
ncbi:helix-turn-helix domain-containing protein [Paenibacillus ehimensis]|uniref:helix-turn-helix domain-containing protein n=1 Tax=Paenibacillus ehimensis TaxID=79264 RepID=UPI0004722377|nr:helix-turn-helix transcriptional regulator [Paenibacillus ehimensis]